MSNYYVLTILHLGNLIQFMKLQPRICEKKNYHFSNPPNQQLILLETLKLGFPTIAFQFFTKAVPVPGFFIVRFLRYGFKNLIRLLLLKQPSLLKISFSYPSAGLFEYLFMFWLHRHLPAKQALNSKQSAKGYEKIIREILR